MEKHFTKPIHFNLPDAEMVYFPAFLDTAAADGLFNHLLQVTPWQQDDIKIFGKTYAQPRLTALYGNDGKSYSYSNITMQPHPWTDRLHELKSDLENIASTEFSTVLLNLYRDGKDSNGWHADDERELGLNPIIASISLGAERYFHLQHKNDKSWKQKFLLEHGSLLLMKGTTQHFWKHQIPKTAKPVKSRINLTFRKII